MYSWGGARRAGTRRAFSLRLAPAVHTLPGSLGRTRHPSRFHSERQVGEGKPGVTLWARQLEPPRAPSCWRGLSQGKVISGPCEGRGTSGRDAHRASSRCRLLSPGHRSPSKPLAPPISRHPPISLHPPRGPPLCVLPRFLSDRASRSRRKR